MATQYSWLGNPMNRGGWWTTVYEVTKNWPWLNNWATVTTTQISSILKSLQFWQNWGYDLYACVFVSNGKRDRKFHKSKNCVLSDTSQVLNKWINKWMPAKTCDKINVLSLINIWEIWIMKSGVRNRIRRNEATFLIFVTLLNTM